MPWAQLKANGDSTLLATIAFTAAAFLLRRKISSGESGGMTDVTHIPPPTPMPKLVHRVFSTKGAKLLRTKTKMSLGYQATSEEPRSTVFGTAFHTTQ